MPPVDRSLAQDDAHGVRTPAWPAPDPISPPDPSEEQAGEMVLDLVHCSATPESLDTRAGLRCVAAMWMGRPQEGRISPNTVGLSRRGQSLSGGFRGDYVRGTTPPGTSVLTGVATPGTAPRGHVIGYLWGEGRRHIGTFNRRNRGHLVPSLGRPADAAERHSALSPKRLADGPGLTPCGRDVWVQVEDIVWVVGGLDLSEPVVFVAVGASDPVLFVLCHEVHVATHTGGVLNQC